MLPAAVTITGAGGGPGTYTATVLFSDASKAPFVQVGDTLEDRLGNQYQIDDWVGSPSDFASGGTMIVSFITTDTAPATFGGFGNALVFTPGQVDVRPLVQSAGIINTQTLNSGQNSLFDITASWFNSASASNVTVGDHIMDASGKVYEITVTNGGGTIVTAQEVVREGTSPTLGDATLYSPTSNLGLFQGTPVSDPARTQARNKDDFSIDARVTEIESQLAGASNSIVQKTVTNLSGSLIAAHTAVGTTLAGSIATIDVSDEASAKSFQGITAASIASLASGTIAQTGRLENVTTAFSYQDDLYIAKDGTITNVAPEIGSAGFLAGDFVIYVGTVAQNQDNPANFDYVLLPTIVGQL